MPKYLIIMDFALSLLVVISNVPILKQFAPNLTDLGFCMPVCGANANSL